MSQTVKSKQSKKVRYAHAILCEDVRQETGNKISLMGMLGTDLNIEGEPPVFMTRLAIVGWIVTPKTELFKDATIVVRMVDQDIVTQALKPEWKDERPDVISNFAQFVLVMAGVNIASAGMIEVEVEIDGVSYLANRTRINFLKPAA